MEASDGLKQLSIRKLRDYIHAFNLNSVGLIEKIDMVNLIFRTKLASENENYFRKLAYEVNNSGSDNNTNSRPRPHDTSQPPRKKSNTNNNEDDKPSQPFNAFFNFFKDGNSNEPESSRNPMSDILSNFFQSTATMAENGAKDKAPQSSSGRSSGATGSNNSNQQSSSSEFRTATGATNSTPQSSSSGQPNFSYSSNYQTTNTYTNASTFQTTSDNNTTPSNANEHANREPPKAKNPTPTVQYIIENNISVSTLSIRDLKRILLDNNVASSSSIEKHDLVVQLERLISAIKIENKESKSFPDELLCKICCDQVVNCVILECGHLVVCQECGEKLKESVARECPICRGRISRLVHTFRS